MSRLIGFLFLLLLSTASHASFLYRADTRPPEEIFRSGFAPSGSNPSLFQHVTGYTCQPGEQTTGFIATSSSEQFAIGWGRDTFTEGTHFYVYRIRSSLHFYNAGQSLFHASHQTGDTVYEYAGWTYLAESEWVTPRTIPAADVIEATEYVSRGRDALPERVQSFENPDAPDAPGQINHGPYEWDYSRDDPGGSGPAHHVCGNACFNMHLHPTKRDVHDPDDDLDESEKAMDEPRRKMTSVLRCRAKAALATYSILDIIDDNHRNTEL
ncbi:enterotoxin A family protein [Luteibacter sp. CQ10]|uniref:enterotoxin A family protein n=1 Tax=Luteibacter sp. CQ10 TaxID=2805821 RepID=UPI0034A180B4